MLRKLRLLVHITLTLVAFPFGLAADEYKTFKTDKKEHEPAATGEPFEASCEEPFRSPSAVASKFKTRDCASS